MYKFVTYAILALAIATAPPTAARSWAALGDCGQPSSSGATPVATDALFTLAAAVGSAICELCVCDVDDSGAVTASDALRILRVAVGQAQSLECPACPPASCGDAAAPECGGLCPDGLACAPAREDPEGCECLNACRLSEAPSCGGSCEVLGDPSLGCQAVEIEQDGAPPFAFCECLPMGIQASSQAAAPFCGGACPPGTICGDDGDGACGCAPLPVQGPCEQAQSPACAGTCSGATICEPDEGGGCMCVPYVGQAESCFDESGPMCGGVCAFGEMCSVNFDVTCNCFSECDLSDAPACGGACSDDTKSCVATTASVGGSSIQYCSCQ